MKKMSNFIKLLRNNFLRNQTFQFKNTIDSTLFTSLFHMTIKGLACLVVLDYMDSIDSMQSMLIK